MGWLRRDRRYPPYDSGYPGWQSPVEPQSHWPAPQWPAPRPDYHAAVQPQPPAPPLPAWPAPYGQPANDQEHVAAVAAAEAAEATHVVGGNGHVDGILYGRVKVIERFQGPRLKHQTTWWRRVRSLLLLLLVGFLMAGALAAVLAMVVWGISAAVHAATTG